MTITIWSVLAPAGYQQQGLWIGGGGGVGGGWEGGGVSMSRDKFKGNLAHKFMDVYFLCFSFHSDISNRLKMKKNLKY